MKLHNWLGARQILLKSIAVVCVSAKPSQRLRIDVALGPKLLSGSCLGPLESLLPDSEHDSPVDISSLETLENLVDRFERLRLDDRLYLAFSGKAQSLFLIEPRAYNRAPDGIAVQH